MTTMVYKYGLSCPTYNATAVDRQMRLAHEYRNTLVQIERGRRAAMRGAEERWAGVCALRAMAIEADAAVAAAFAAVKAARASSRSRSEGAPMREALDVARQKKRAGLELVAEARRKLREDTAFIAEADRINELAAGLRRSAREHCGVYWGSYLLVEAADAASRSMPLYDGIEPNDPAFVRWTGDGRVAVQIQGGMPTEDIFGADTRVQIDAVDQAPWLYKSPVGERRRAARTKLRLRIGSTERGKPIWAEWPMVMHRPLPPGQIKWVTVSARIDGARSGRSGTFVRWAAEITAELEGSRRRHRPPQHEGASAVGVNLGWRLMEDAGIRVARWHGTDGASGELRLPRELVGMTEKVEDLQAIRDNYFDVARDALVGYSGTAAAPPWLLRTCATLSQWRSIGRLRNVVRRWRRERDGATDGHDGMFGTLDAWERRDHHLWAWQHAQRQNYIARRNDLASNLAAELARRYDVLVLEEFDLRPMRRTTGPTPEDAPLQVAPQRANQHAVAPGELRRALRDAFGADEALVPAPNTTRECHVCHVVEAFDAATEVRHTCQNGHEWDQDDNAAINLIERWRDAQSTAPAREAATTNENKEVRESRWVRARRLKAEKDARKLVAREVVSTDAE